MKKIFVLIILSIAGFSCKDCEVTKPKHKPIDWGNYNDVHTVYWNYTGKCSDFKEERPGPTIKMYGWIQSPHSQYTYPHDFYLIGDSLLVEANQNGAYVRIQCFNDKEYEALQAKFDTSDLTKKCFVTGELVTMNLEAYRCCHVTPNIFIEDADNVYFE